MVYLLCNNKGRYLHMKRRNKKGFTLVELLAVIVILIIILLIAFNKTKNASQKAKLDSVKANAINYVKMLKDLIGEDLVDTEGLDAGYFTPSYLETYGLKVSGQKPDAGYFILDNYTIMLYCLQYGDYYTMDVDAKDPIKEGSCPDPGLSKEYAYSGKVEVFDVKVSGDYVLEVWGAQGGGRQNYNNGEMGYGGKGGYSKGTIHLNYGDKLYVYVGGQGSASGGGLASGGFNGGGSAWASGSSDPAAGGGGATDIRVNEDTLLNRVIVAGGGGGGGEDSETGGFGGGISAGSSPSVSGSNQTWCGEGATFGLGANTRRDGGGGGGGWYGGGTLGGTQSAPTSNDSYDTNGGAGGSGFVYISNPSVSGYALSEDYMLESAFTMAGNQEVPVVNSEETSTGHSGNGYAKITYVTNDAKLNVSYAYIGKEETYIVPRTGKYKLEVWGGQAGTVNANGATIEGGFGGYSVGFVTLSEGQVLYINVGGQGTSNEPGNVDGGYNGGGLCTKDQWGVGASGGGATSITLKIVAGGGGGGGVETAGGGRKSYGGNAGGYIGNSGSCTGNDASGAGGAQLSGSAFGKAVDGGGWWAAPGGGFYGGYTGCGAGGGSGYIANPLLTDKEMFCYSCTENGDPSTKTTSTTCAKGGAEENCAKKGPGAAKITFIE